MLLPVTAAFLVGLALGSYLPYLPALILLILLLGGLALTGLEWAERMTVRQGLLVYGATLAGVVYWTGAAWLQSAPPLAESAGSEPVALVGTIVEPVRYAPGRLVAVLSVSQLGPSLAASSPVRGRLRLTWRDPDRVLGQGDQVVVTARIRAPSGPANPGGADVEALLARQGIGAVASLSGPGQVAVLARSEFSRWQAWRWVEGWRHRIREAAVSTLSGAALGLYLGIIIGEPGSLAPEVRDRFMATGTVHILSISGSHLGLIAFLAFACAKVLGRHLPTAWLLALSRRITVTRLAALLTTLPVVLYTLLAGAEVATVRSLIMILVFLLAVWLGRGHRLILALASAAWLILLHEPVALYDISFQLSYLSVLAIAVVIQRSSDPAQEAMPEPPLAWSLRRWLREYAAITGGVTLATAPLVAYYFNQVAWLGLVANLVVVPVVGFVLVPLGLGSALWLVLTGAEGLPAGALIQRLYEWLADAVAWLAAVPGAQWHVASPTIPAIAGFYVLLGLAVRRTAGRPARAIAALGVALLLGWWFWSPRTGLDGETVRVTFLDVGQGDATVIELPDGQTVLIDGGAHYDTLDMGRAVVGPFLWDRGIRRLDHVIGTHPQLDHVGGLAWVLDAFPVGAYWSNGVGREEGFYARLRDALARRGLTERVVRAGDRILSTGSCRLDVLNPPANHGPAGQGPELEDLAVAKTGTLLNNLSVVTRLDCGPHSVLFTADLEREGLARLRQARSPHRATVVKVPHHGARSSLDLEWVRSVGAKIAIVSVGRRNPYGHPAAEVLSAYERAGIQLYRTDRDGAVTVVTKVSAAPFSVHRERERRPGAVPVSGWRWPAELENLKRLWAQWMGAV